MLEIINLNLMVTRNCNLNCAHCMRGDSVNEDIKDDVLDLIFKPGMVIQHLQLNGGEVFSKPTILKKVIDIIIKKRVILECVTIPTNGTLYTSEIEKELNRLNSYLVLCQLFTGIFLKRYINIDLSKDEYHDMEMSRIKEQNPETFRTYMENINKLRSSKYFNGFRGYDKLINAGKAITLNAEKYSPDFYPIFYSEDYTSIGKVMIVSTIGIDINGTVCNTCGEMPPKGKAIYGSILNQNLEAIIKNIGIKCQNEEELMFRYQDYVQSIINKRICQKLK